MIQSCCLSDVEKANYHYQYITVIVILIIESPSVSEISSTTPATFTFPNGVYRNLSHEIAPAKQYATTATTPFSHA
jgi:hypothetical protein